MLDCECGTTIQAATDDELASAVREHMETDHPDRGMSEDEARELVASRAYEATDA